MKRIRRKFTSRVAKAKKPKLPEPFSDNVSTNKDQESNSGSQTEAIENNPSKESVFETVLLDSNSEVSLMEVQDLSTTDEPKETEEPDKESEYEEESSDDDANSPHVLKNNKRAWEAAGFYVPSETESAKAPLSTKSAWRLRLYSFEDQFLYGKEASLVATVAKRECETGRYV
eukprot:IDg2395t1